MTTCPKCGGSLPESETPCECGYDPTETDDEDRTGAYVRKMRERPYRERLAIRAGFRDPADVEMKELGVLLRVGVLALGLTAFWLGVDPSVLAESSVGRSAGLAAVVQSGGVGRLLVGAVLLAFGVFFTAVSYSGRVPEYGSETNRDLLP
ncbi:hypothetical protein [Halorussus aquaticus]|uniref:Uncharacterized protein n=1 Tax=Halorussus aquaticus TaxID=2953748 RepID=A0ABD5Q4G3_9EURY|nr:hypothetical protein [Halorussus aquaticus]